MVELKKRYAPPVLRVLGTRQDIELGTDRPLKRAAQEMADEAGDSTAP
jgi:hypothetical protein